MRFQYISDIHLEYLKRPPKINKIADNICLLGDIGIPGTQIYTDFISDCSQKFKNVFIIYGNHEYFNMKKHIILNGIESMCKREECAINFPGNVYFLNNDSIYLNKNDNTVIKSLSPLLYKDNYIKIIGSTLWSNVDDIVYNYIKDYKMIYLSDNSKITPEYIRFLFKRNKDYILNEIKREDKVKCILMTHHGTHYLCNGKYNDLSYFKKDKVNLNSAYITHIDELYSLKNLEICLSGHTHSNINEVVNGVRLLSNCKGYPGENQTIVNYNSLAYFDIN